MKYIFASDIHGARNDLPEEYGTKDCTVLLNEYFNRIIISIFRLQGRWMTISGRSKILTEIYLKKSKSRSDNLFMQLH